LVETRPGLLDVELVGPQQVGESARGRRHRRPTTARLVVAAIREGEQSPQAGVELVELLLTDPLPGQPTTEPLAPYVVDHIDDLRLLHEVVDELCRKLELARVEGVAELAGRRNGLVHPRALTDAFPDLVRPVERDDRVLG
jgi:hypothetical protein